MYDIWTYVYYSFIVVIHHQFVLKV